MPYQAGSRLGAESASKLGHLAVVSSEWVKSLVIDFDRLTHEDIDSSGTKWEPFDASDAQPLRTVWAVDGSYARVKTEMKPPKEVAFVKTALLTIDRGRLDTIDKHHPHPLLLQDILRDSAVFHATVFPLKNIKTPLGTNFDAVRNIINDSMKVDENGVFFETLKWLAFKKWNPIDSHESPHFQCPHCDKEREGLKYNLEQDKCPECHEQCFLTDMLGFHLDMDEDSAPDSVASAYMTMMEHLMLFTAIRLLWNHSDPGLVGETLFIRDGPMTLRGQYWKLVPRIREFLQYAVDQRRPIHIVGQEKTGAFVDHLASIAKFAPPQEEGEPSSFAALSHGYISKEVHRRSKRTNPYGERTNWGEKLYLKLDPRTKLVLNIPTGAYKPDDDFPSSSDMIGLSRIIATIPSLISRKHEDGLYPIELANAVASMSSYPSGKVLKKFMEDPK